MGVIKKKKKSKTLHFMLGFQILRVYKFIFCTQYLLTLSLALASQVSLDAEQR